jgi:hypothetical protein
MQKEIWRDVPNYEGRYQVSSIGRVRSMNYKRTSKIKILKHSLNSGGYECLNLCKNGKPRLFLVHQLVAIAFLGHIPNNLEMVVDHIDNNKDNNTLSNLQVITQRENATRSRISKYTKYTGAYYDKEAKRWLSSIKFNGSVIRLGTFKTDLEAHNAYINKLKEITI